MSSSAFVSSAVVICRLRFDGGAIFNGIGGGFEQPLTAAARSRIATGPGSMGSAARQAGESGQEWCRLSDSN